jgi:hypothetical protein
MGNLFAGGRVEDETMAVRQYQRAVGIFAECSDVKRALHALKDDGFPMEQVSVVVRNSRAIEAANETEITMFGNKSDESAVAGAAAGGALGILTGLFVGMGIVVLPGLGPVLLGGAAATALATALSGGAIGVVTGGLLGGLIGLGIPEERAKVYSDRITQGEYLVLIEGLIHDVHQAEAVLVKQGVQEWNVYRLPVNYVPSTNAAD